MPPAERLAGLSAVYTQGNYSPLQTGKGFQVSQRGVVALREKCCEGWLCSQAAHLHRTHWHSHLLEIWQQSDCGRWCMSGHPMHRQSPPHAHCPAGMIRSHISTDINYSQRQSRIFPAFSETEHACLNKTSLLDILPRRFALVQSFCIWRPSLSSLS